MTRTASHPGAGARRRADARARRLNGIDGIDVSDDRLALTVTFFGPPPGELAPHHLRVDGGRRVTGIRVTAVEPCGEPGPEQEGRVRLTLDRPGDLSPYRLSVVAAGPGGEPGTEPYPGFDARYSSAAFTFHPECAGLDGAPPGDCAPPAPPAPEIDYLAKDYASFRQLMLDRLSLTMPGGAHRHVPDIGIALVELLAHEADRLSYLQDAVATEAYLGTARHRISVRRHARLVDYALHDGCAARAWITLHTDAEVTLPAGDFHFVTLPRTVLPESGAALLERDLARRGIPPHEAFEPVHHEPVVLRPAHNTIRLWTWGGEETCLPAGATAATLVDGDPPGTAGPAARHGHGHPRPPGRALSLAPGDVLIFEELIGAATGAPADADVSHRQAVRLTSVTEAVDPLYRQPLLQITWDRADALAFPLCLTARGGPGCAEHEVGVARGNVVLVEHGRATGAEDLPVPGPPPGEPGCPEPTPFGCPGEQAPGTRPGHPPLASRFRPVLAGAPVTQRPPFPAPADVAAAQARHLLGLPERARARLTALWRRLLHDELGRADREYLAILFGAATLRRVRLDAVPGQALRVLIARFGDLLAAKLDRLGELIRRARSGQVLRSADEGWEIGQSWGEAEGAALDEASPAFRGPAAPATRPDPRAALPDAEITDRHGRTWTPRRDLLESGPADRHFVGETNDEGLLTLRFGDGRHGAAFPPGSTARARYRVGGGPAGNAASEAISRIVFRDTRAAGITLVRNPLPASGGTAPEPVAEARRRAPQEARHRLLRAVTAADYATLAGATPGVQRAAADLRWTGSWYEAQIALDAHTTGTAPAWLLDEVGAAAHRYRRIGHDLAVSTATAVPLDIALRVEVDADHLAGHVYAALLRAFGTGPGGHFHPDRLTFGTPVRASRLVAAAVAVPGVRHAEVTRLERLFGPPGDALATGVLPVGPLEVPRLDNDPSRPEDGRLTLELGGGR